MRLGQRGGVGGQQEKGGQEEGREMHGGGGMVVKERRNFPPHLTLAQAALGLHKGGPPSSGPYWSLRIG